MKTLKSLFNFFMIVAFSGAIIVLFNRCEKDSVNDDENPEISEIAISTGIVSNIDRTTCIVTGNISSLGEGISNHGFCWAETSNPTTNDNKIDLGSTTTIGDFTGNLTGLTEDTTYYVRAYATSSNTPVYGASKPFTTVAYNVPVVTTNDVSDIGENTAKSGGNITDDGGSPITARGVCWSTTENPTVSDSKTTDGSGTGSFTSDLTNLSESTTYFVRAYATNSVGSAYDENNQTFTTLTSPPIAPSNLVVNAINPSTISLSWDDNSTNETGFEIQIQTLLSNGSSMYVTVETVGPNVESLTRSNLDSTWLGYLVKAINEGGSSESNIARAPAKIRIINDLYSTTGSQGTDWYKFNKIVRLRIGPTSSSVTADGNTYERLCMYDALSTYYYPNYVNYINPSYNSTSQYEDFPVSTYGYGSSYYVYAQCGWWEYYYYADTGTDGYDKRISMVLDFYGNCCIEKWAWKQIINHDSGYVVLKASEMGLVPGHWNNTVWRANEGGIFDAKAKR